MAGCLEGKGRSGRYHLLSGELRCTVQMYAGKGCTLVLSSSSNWTAGQHNAVNGVEWSVRMNMRK